MATQNSTITVKGKLGNIVGYKGRDGKRLARIRQTEVKNPRTDGQIIQRMILATASKAYGLMKSICDHSWQGVSYGGVSQSYFLKKAMERIRKFVADAMAAFPASITDPLQWVGLARPDRLWETGYGLQISEGTIPSVSATYAKQGEGEDADDVLDHFGSLIETATQENRATNNDVLRAIGAKPGDQITAVAILANGVFAKSRYVIKADATSEELAENWPTNYNIDGGPFDENDTIVSQEAYIVANGKKLQVTSGTSEVAAAAIIISRKESNTWQRSTQYLMPVSMVSSVDAIIKLWQLGTTEIPTENPYYLNNADL